MFAADEAIVFFTCANIAATKIREKAHLYETFSRDELDGVMFHCMDVYKKLKEKRPYDGSVPFEVYVAKFVLPMGRQAYAASKETDNDHLVSTARNSKGETVYYGTNGKMVMFTSMNEMDEDNNDSGNLYTSVEGFENAVIDKVDSELLYVDDVLLKKLDGTHPLLRIVFRFWAIDCKESFVPFYKYLSDERVLNQAAADEKCAKYVLQKADGERYINPSTASKILYKFQDTLTSDDVNEIFRFGVDIQLNPYLRKILVNE